MNKLKVFEKVFHKRAASGFPVKSPGTVLLLFLMIPYIITSLVGNAGEAQAPLADVKEMEAQLLEGNGYVYNKTALGTEKIPLEVYTADVLERVMGEGYEMEARKAQAILIRTNLISGTDEEITVSDEEYGKSTVRMENLQAVCETRGICVYYEGNPVYGAYFLVSGGNTRCAGEIPGMENYPYLVQVPCERDYMSKDYMHKVEYSVEEFEKVWEKCREIKEEEIPDQTLMEETGEIVIAKDGAGYGLFLKYREKWILCEELRYELRLPSSDFKIEKEGGGLVFTVKGSGHGLGMSQFGANEMALKGKDFDEILRYFFRDVNIQSFE